MKTRRLILLLLVASAPMWATSRTWTGVTGDTKVSTPGNWSPNGSPSGADLVFNGSCGATCLATFDTTITVASISVDSTYGSTITQDASAHISVTGSFSLSAGMLVTSTAGMEVGGMFTVNKLSSVDLADGIVFHDLVIWGYVHARNLTVNGLFYLEPGARVVTELGSILTIGDGAVTIFQCNVDFNASAWTSVVIYKPTSSFSLSSGCTLTPYGAVYAAAFTNNGTFHAPANMYITNNWANNGTFDPGTGNVWFLESEHFFQGTQNTTFYDWTAITDGGHAISIKPGLTITVLHDMVAHGSANGQLRLTNYSTGTWNIDVRGSRTLSYLWVHGANNINASQMVAGSTSTDGGGNTFWSF